MPKLIGLEKIKPIDFPSTEMDGLDVVRYLNTLPTVDAVEVVLCMECKHVKFDRCNGEYMCDHSYGGMVNVEARSFCSYGERKNNG